MATFSFKSTRGATLVELMFVIGVMGFLAYKGLKYYAKTHVPPPKVFETGTVIQDIEALSLIKPTWGPKVSTLRLAIEDSKTRPTGPALAEASKKIASALSANPQNVVSILGDATVYNQSGQSKRRIIVGGRLVAGLSTKPPNEMDAYQAVRDFEGYLVVRADGSNYRLNLHGQPSTAHIWRNPATGQITTVFFTYSPATAHMSDQTPTGLYVDEEPWKGDFHMDSCVVAHEPGIPASAFSNSKCLTGIVTDPKGLKMPMTYGYFTDWAARQGTRIVMGGQAMVPLSN